MTESRSTDGNGETNDYYMKLSWKGYLRLDGYIFNTREVAGLGENKQI